MVVFLKIDILFHTPLLLLDILIYMNEAKH